MIGQKHDGGPTFGPFTMETGIERLRKMPDPSAPSYTGPMQLRGSHVPSMDYDVIELVEDSTVKKLLHLHNKLVSELSRVREHDDALDAHVHELRQFASAVGQSIIELDFRLKVIEESVTELKEAINLIRPECFDLTKE